MKRIVTLFFTFLMLFIGVASGALLHADAASRPGPPEVRNLPKMADSAVQTLFSRIPGLGSIAPSLLLLGGENEQNGVFLTESGALIENIAPPDEGVLEANIAGIEAFLDAKSIPTAVMLIPTACAVKQHEIPALAQIYNQKALIGAVYDRLLGRATSVDVYSSLFAAKAQYTYYRTESNLTGLGGYYVYADLVSRLGRAPRALGQFEVEHLEKEYVGPLAARTKYASFKPDIITLYSFSRYDREYRFVHTQDNTEKIYYSLFPRHLEALSRPQDAFSVGLGSAWTSPSPRRMRYPADFRRQKRLAYLPFLVVHYSTVTVVDLETAIPKFSLGSTAPV
jgi:hypothetical protein